MINAAAFCAALVIHSLFLAPFVLGNSARRPHFIPDSFGAGSSALVSSAQFPSAMTLVQLTSEVIDDREALLADLASRGIEKPTSLMIASMDARPATVDFDESAIEDNDAAEAAGDTEGHAVMFGKYMGQVSARIERAWVRPRGPIGAERFECETKIEQDRAGRVISVELRKCNGDWHWQQSLVAAIQGASPLSAPPEPTVWAGSLILNFEANEYVQGIAIESEYEPQTLFAKARASAVSSETLTNTDKALADVARLQRHIDLKIQGKDMTWTLKRDPTRPADK